MISSRFSRWSSPRMPSEARVASVEAITAVLTRVGLRANTARMEKTHWRAMSSLAVIGPKGKSNSQEERDDRCGEGEVKGWNGDRLRPAGRRPGARPCRRGLERPHVRRPDGAAAGR